jgi:hypothetical protein
VASFALALIMFWAFESPGAGEEIFQGFHLARRFGPSRRFEHERLIKEGFGIHVLLTHSLFDGGIPRRLLLRVSLAKPPSAPVRF